MKFYWVQFEIFLFLLVFMSLIVEIYSKLNDKNDDNFNSGINFESFDFLSSKSYINNSLFRFKDGSSCSIKYQKKKFKDLLNISRRENG